MKAEQRRAVNTSAQRLDAVVTTKIRLREFKRFVVFSLCACGASMINTIAAPWRSVQKLEPRTQRNGHVMSQQPNILMRFNNSNVCLKLVFC